MSKATRIPDLGPRGEGWVVLQSVLFCAIVACSFLRVGWPGSVALPLEIVGALVGVGGLVLLVWGVTSLGRSLTPLPRPDSAAEFRQGGAFTRVRHPIYGGVLLIVFGWSVAGAPIALIPSALLAALFALKSRLEETWLVARYPEYAGYRASTPHRFIPWRS